MNFTERWLRDQLLQQMRDHVRLLLSGKGDLDSFDSHFAGLPLPETVALHKIVTEAGLKGERQLTDGVTDAELRYEARFAAAVAPHLTALYEVGIDALRSLPVEVDTEDEVFRYLVIALSVSAAADALLDTLVEQMIAGVNLGGQLSLEQMGAEDTSFDLQSAQILEEVRVDAEESLEMIIATTAKELASGFVRVTDESGQSAALIFLASIITGAVAYRSLLIARHEGVGMTRLGMWWAYKMNGVLRIEFRTQRDGRVDNGDPLGPCNVQDGNVYDVDNVPEAGLIPIHFGCRCFYLMIREGWSKPRKWWRGGRRGARR